MKISPQIDAWDEDAAKTEQRASTRHELFEAVFGVPIPCGKVCPKTPMILITMPFTMVLLRACRACLRIRSANLESDPELCGK